MVKLFMSYASSDRVVAESLANQLRDNSYEVWLDVDDIPGGSRWETEITTAIDKTDVCLLIITANTAASEWVKKEIAIARALDKRVIPLVIYDVPRGETLDSLGVADLQAIDFDRYGYAISFKRLLETLPQAQKSPPKDSEARPRALIVEDIPAQQIAIQQVFKVMGIETAVASDFDTAFECIRERPFEIVTLDMQLDEMDTGGQHGLLLLDQLRAQSEATKIIIVSALDWDGRQVRDFLIKYRAFDYLKKPFDPGDLRQIIERALEE